MPKPPIRAARDLNPSKRPAPALDRVSTIKGAPALERQDLLGSVPKGFKKTKAP